MDDDKDVWKITASDLFVTIGIGFQLQRTKAPKFCVWGDFEGFEVTHLRGFKLTHVQPENRVPE